MTNSQAAALDTLKTAMAPSVLRRLDDTGKRTIAAFGFDPSITLRTAADLADLTVEPKVFRIGRRGKVTEVA
jgi:hypothetical protein